MFVHFCLSDRLLGHHGDHVCGFHAAALDFHFIDRLDAIDERHIVFTVGVEVVTEAAIDEDVDDISERDKELEIEALHQQRQDVLRANTFEAFRRTVPVLKFFFLALQDLVVLVLIR